MSNNDKIYDLFKRNEHKLSKKPSRRAWERLEDRLDRHEHSISSNNGWARYASMVASLLLLVTIAVVLTMKTQDNTPQFASNDIILEDLPTAPTSSQQFHKIVEYQNEYKNRERRIVEGNYSQKNLKLKGDKTYTHNWKNIPNEAIAFNDVKKESKPSPKVNEISEIANVENIETSDLNALQVETVNITQIAEAVDLLVEKEEEIMPSAPIPIFEEEKSSSNTETTSSGSSVPPGSVAPTSKPSPSSAGGGGYADDMVVVESKMAKEEVAAKKDRTADYDINTNQEGYYLNDNKAKENTDEINLNIFRWILGNWEQNINGSSSTEEWKKIDEKVFKGKGYLTVNNVTLFSEKLELRKTNKGIFMIVSLDKSKKKIKYQLDSYNDSFAVFKNNKIDYPNQITLYKLSDNSFSLIMHNGDKTKMTAEQYDHFRNRNQFEKDKIIRILSKKK